MTLDAIRNILNRRPYEPVRMTMSSGAVFEIRHPEMALLARSAMMVVFPDVDGGPSDRWEFLSYLHVAHVETMSASAGTPPSGQAA
jgi:hypothetical protein